MGGLQQQPVPAPDQRPRVDVGHPLSLGTACGGTCFPLHARRDRPRTGHRGPRRSALRRRPRDRSDRRCPNTRMQYGPDPRHPREPHRTPRSPTGDRRSGTACPRRRSHRPVRVGASGPASLNGGPSDGVVHQAQGAGGPQGRGESTQAQGRPGGQARCPQRAQAPSRRDPRPARGRQAADRDAEGGGEGGVEAGREGRARPAVGRAGQEVPGCGPGTDPRAGPAGLSRGDLRPRATRHPPGAPAGHRARPAHRLQRARCQTAGPHRQRRCGDRRDRGQGQRGQGQGR